MLAELDAEQVAVVDLRRARWSTGELEPTSELDLHLGVYDRYDAGAVVHTHAPMATALSCVLDELPCVHYEMLLLGGSVRVAPYATFGTPELAELVARGARGPDRGADGQPRRGRCTAPTLDRRAGARAAARVGLRASTGARAAIGDAAGARRGASARPWSRPRVERGYGTTKPADEDG